MSTRPSAPRRAGHNGGGGGRQAAYAARNSGPPGVPSNWTSNSLPAERPHWMRRHPFKRGLALLIFAQILFVVIGTVVKPGSVVADLLSFSLLVAMVIGLAGVVVGIRDALKRRRAKAAS
ncbi:hypothetical protein [Frigidibacter mobilis]|uniref:hypothetical protein n=1 Tax=Frigidibacter mobilis TaxID=1335048 RepID=UPI0014135E51|nr:hypothetical protein [Frigidibacter mobilis]